MFNALPVNAVEKWMSGDGRRPVNAAKSTAVLQSHKSEKAATKKICIFFIHNKTKYVFLSEEVA